MLQIVSVIITIRFIIVLGNMYNSEAGIPLYLQVNIIDDMLKPVIKPFIYVRNILNNTPIMVNPSIHINITNVQFIIKLFFMDIN